MRFTVLIISAGLHVLGCAASSSRVRHDDNRMPPTVRIVAAAGDESYASSDVRFARDTAVAFANWTWTPGRAMRLEPRSYVLRPRPGGLRWFAFETLHACFDPDDGRYGFESSRGPLGTGPRGDGDPVPPLSLIRLHAFEGDVRRRSLPEGAWGDQCATDARGNVHAVLTAPAGADFGDGPLVGPRATGRILVAVSYDSELRLRYAVPLAVGANPGGLRAVPFSDGRLGIIGTRPTERIWQTPLPKESRFFAILDLRNREVERMWGFQERIPPPVERLIGATARTPDRENRFLREARSRWGPDIHARSGTYRSGAEADLRLFPWREGLATTVFVGRAASSRARRVELDGEARILRAFDLGPAHGLVGSRSAGLGHDRFLVQRPGRLVIAAPDGRPVATFPIVARGHPSCEVGGRRAEGRLTGDGIAHWVIEVACLDAPARMPVHVRVGHQSLVVPARTATLLVEVRLSPGSARSTTETAPSTTSLTSGAESLQSMIRAERAPPT